MITAEAIAKYVSPHVDRSFRLHDMCCELLIALQLVASAETDHERSARVDHIAADVARIQAELRTLQKEWFR